MNSSIYSGKLGRESACNNSISNSSRTCRVTKFTFLFQTTMSYTDLYCMFYSEQKVRMMVYSCLIQRDLLFCLFIAILLSQRNRKNVDSFLFISFFYWNSCQTRGTNLPPKWQYKCEHKGGGLGLHNKIVLSDVHLLLQADIKRESQPPPNQSTTTI